VNSTTTTLVQRLRQARALLLRAQLALTGAQILFWVASIGIVLAVALRLLRRRSGGGSAIHAGLGAAPDAVASATPPTRFLGSTDREEVLEASNSQEGNANG
jgi:hypothetical protein